MKFARLIGLAVLLTGALFFFFFESNQAAPSTSPAEGENVIPSWVKVQKPLPNIYTKMEPGSEIIRQGKRGEYIEVLSAGESWHKVRVEGKDGFVEVKTVGKPVTMTYEQAQKKNNPAIVMFLIVVVLMLGCAGFAVFLINRQQQQQAAAAPTDDD
jgi:flagellar basal body-associated protein FliL